MLSRPDKEKIVERIKKNIDGSNAIFLTNLIGISSNEANDLRKKVRESNGTLSIARNTLMARAAKGTKAEELLSNLKGPTAVAFAFEDAPGVAKAIYEAGKVLELVTIRGGLLKEQTLSAEDVVALAKLPSRNEMLATLLATFNAPISAFARVLHAVNEQKKDGQELTTAPELA